MKKYFITSDLHSFFYPFMDALTKAGFEYNNPDHILVICGDLFDRGEETILLYEWIKGLPKEKRILIRGNHEYLLRDLIRKDGEPNYYDFSNGTVKTCCTLADVPYSHVNFTMLYVDDKTKKSLWKKIKKNKLINTIIDWMFSDEWVDYFDVGKYTCVHSFIPLKHMSQQSFRIIYSDSEELKYDEDWRTSHTPLEWQEATWGCPYQLFSQGYFKDKDRILVCGHWHTWDFFSYLDGDYTYAKKQECPIYNNHGIVGLDACTVLTHKVNIFVVEEEDKR